MATELNNAEQKMVQERLWRKHHQDSMLKYATPIALVLKATLISDISSSKRFDSNSIQFAKQANRIRKKDGGFKIRTEFNSKLSTPCASVVEALVFSPSPVVDDTVSNTGII